MSEHLLWWVSYHPMTMKEPHVEHHYDENKTKYFETKEEAEEFKKEISKTLPDGRWIHVDMDWVWKHQYLDKIGSEKMNENIIEEFENMRYMAELRVYSKLSLQRKLTNKEFERMMELKTIIFGE